jgi:hypothetical protein
MFRVLSAPIIRSTIKTIDTVIGTFHVSMWCGLNPLKGVQGRESIAQCHGQVRTGLSAAKFAHHSGGSDWESLTQRSKILRVCAFYKVYTG